MKSNSLFLKALIFSLFFISTSSKADNPSEIFGIALGQNVFELSSIEKFGSMHMNYKVEPNKPMTPFDLYSIKSNNHFQVQGIYARAKVDAEACENKLERLARKVETNLGLSLDKILVKKKVKAMLSQ